MKSAEFHKKIQNMQYKGLVLQLAFAARDHQITQAEFEAILQALLAVPGGRELFSETTSVPIYADPSQWDDDYRDMVLNHISVGDVNVDLMRQWVRMCGLKERSSRKFVLPAALLAGGTTVLACTVLGAESLTTALLCIVIALVSGAVVRSIC